MSEGVLIAVIGIVGAILGAVVGGLIQAALQRRKDDASVNEMITKSVTSLIQPLNDRIDAQGKVIEAQGKKIVSLETSTRDWRNCAEARGRQLERASMVPAPFVSTEGK